MLRSIISRMSPSEDAGEETAPTRTPLGYVIVPKSAVERCAEEPGALVQALVEFVTYMLETGGYDREELPAGAIEAFHCQTYLSHIETGGHAQFMAAHGANSEALVHDAMNAMAGMKAKRHIKAAKLFARWMAKNSEQMDEVAGDPAILESVFEKQDQVFAKAEQNEALVLKNARWIGAWPHLLIVEDAKLAEALAVAAQANAPVSPPETVEDQPMDPVDHALSDPLSLALGMASAAARPAEALISIGEERETPEDGNVLIWDVLTTAGKRQVITDDEIGAKLTRIPSASDTVETLSSVTIDELEAAQRMLGDIGASAQIRALIAEFFPDTPFCSASIGHALLDGNGQPDVWAIVTLDEGRTAFSALLTTSGAVAFEEPSHKLIGHVPRDNAAGDMSDAA